MTDPKERSWVAVWSATLVLAFMVGMVTEKTTAKGCAPERAPPAPEPPVYLSGDPKNPANQILRLQTEISGLGEAHVELERQLDKLEATVVELRAKREADHDELKRAEDMMAAMAGDIHRRNVKP